MFSASVGPSQKTRIHRRKKRALDCVFCVGRAVAKNAHLPSCFLRRSVLPSQKTLINVQIYAPSGITWVTVAKNAPPVFFRVFDERVCVVWGLVIPSTQRCLDDFGCLIGQHCLEQPAFSFKKHIWLVVSTQLKNISQIGNLPPKRDENKRYFKPPPRYGLINPTWKPMRSPTVSWCHRAPRLWW